MGLLGLLFFGLDEVGRLATFAAAETVFLPLPKTQPINTNDPISASVEARATKITAMPIATTFTSPSINASSTAGAKNVKAIMATSLICRLRNPMLREFKQLSVHRTTPSQEPWPLLLSLPSRSPCATRRERRRQVPPSPSRPIGSPGEYSRHARQRPRPAWRRQSSRS